MSIDEFKDSVHKQPTPPAHLNALLQALWHDAKGDWESAHNLAQDVNTKDGSWIHAYLHRKEGDLSNASYWYHKASKPVCKKSLPEEWEDIAATLLH
jgi:hypothetical protein